VLEAIEQMEGDVRPALALVAGESVDVDVDERRAALRRAMLLLAAGGDPHEGLALDGRAVTSLAAELDTDARRDDLRRGLGELREATGKLELPSVGAALAELEDGELAWRSFACALLAEEVAE
jgi:hypothetical protein